MVIMMKMMIKTSQNKLNELKLVLHYPRFSVFRLFECNLKSSIPNTYEEGPKNNRNLNVARELEVVARCAVRCHEPRPHSSSLSLGVDLG
jgi:hypothetical protein